MNDRFEAFVDLDSVTIHCPCGEQITGQGAVVQHWIDRHKPHTNQRMRQTITDDGMRVLPLDTVRVQEVEV